MIKDKIKTQKSLVKKLRAIRDKFNKDIQDMTLEEEQKYLEKCLLNGRILRNRTDCRKSTLIC